MDPLSIGEQTAEEASTVLKALADPNRLCIFDLLMQGDWSNCELNDRLGLPPNLLSHHLHALREAGLVDSHRDEADARWIFYTVNPTVVDNWRTWFNEFLDPARIQSRLALYRPEEMPACTTPLSDMGQELQKTEAEKEAREL